MNKLMALLFASSIFCQPLYCELLNSENGYVNSKLDKKTYFAGASSIKDEHIVRKPASIEKEAFYKRYIESKEDKFSYIFIK